MTQAPAETTVLAAQPGWTAERPPAPGGDPDAGLHTALQMTASEGAEHLLLTPALVPPRH